MRVFSSSVAQAADTFLHAGYVSATPTGVLADHPSLKDPDNLGYVTTMSEAFATEVTAVPLEAAAATAPGTLETFSGALGAAMPSMMLAAGAIACVIMLVRLFQARPALPVPATASLLVLLILGGGFGGACIDEQEPGPGGQNTSQTPDRKVQFITTYADPELATTVLLHVILREAVTYHVSLLGPAYWLTSVQEQLALPMDTPDEGLTMALADFTADAWGDELTFLNDDAGELEGAYWIGSAGEDGLSDTEDDIDLFIQDEELYHPMDWDHVWKVYYLQRRDGELWMYTRIPGNCNLGDNISWEDTDPGETLWTYYQGAPVSAEVQSHWWQMANYGPDEPDWETNVAALEAVYETFVTDEEPEPLVIQIFEPALLAG